MRLFGVKWDVFFLWKRHEIGGGEVGIAGGVGSDGFRKERKRNETNVDDLSSVENALRVVKIGATPLAAKRAS